MLCGQRPIGQPADSHVVWLVFFIDKWYNVFYTDDQDQDAVVLEESVVNNPK